MTALVLPNVNRRFRLPDPWRLLRPLNMLFDTGQYHPYQPLQFGDALGSVRRPFYKARYFDILSANNLLTNLKLCLDAGDGASLPAASAKWLDTSGGGYDFFLGSSGGVDASDPTINGTANGRTSNEYLSFDGGDWLAYDTTQEAWMSDPHKDNAKFSVAAWVFWPALGNNGIIAGNSNNASQPGWKMQITAANVFSVSIFSASGTQVLASATVTTVNANAWNFVGFSIDEAVGANGLKTNFHGVQENQNSSYLNPSAATAANNTVIGWAASPFMPATSRMAMFAMWTGTALTAAQIDAIYQDTRKRFGV